MRYARSMGYIAAHWRGACSLGRSFWINFVLLRVSVYAALAGLGLVGFIPLALFVVLLGADIVLFVWQAVGLIRAGESHISGHGSLTPVWGSYLAIVFALFFFGIEWLGLFQQTLVKPQEELFTTKMDRLHASTYKLTLSEDSTVLTFDGDIALGSTKKITTLLEENEAVRALVLDSTGGNIYEARGIGRQVRAHGLDTRVRGECSSACTIIFISGRTRTMDDAAKLGFHQYRLDTTAYVPNVDVAAEQERDRSFFEAQAIDKAFLDRIFDSPHSGIWYPERDELRAAGVISQ